MSTMLETLDAQKARLITARVDEVAKEVASERQRQIHRLLQASVYECVALAKHWRAAVEYYTDAISNDLRNFDFRNLRDVLLPAAERTQSIYADVELMLEKTATVVQDRSDLTLAVIEARNIVRWFESWPSNDTTQHKLARESIARGEFVSDAELAAM